MQYKHALRVFGLLLLTALGPMAFAAAGAQAGEIKILGSASLATGEIIDGEQIGEGTLSVPALNIEIVCKKMSIHEGKIISGPKGEGLAKLLFETCKIWTVAKGTLKLVEELKVCQILDEGGTVGQITARVLVLVVLHGLFTYLLAETDPPNPPLAVVKLTSGLGCPLPLKTELSGSVGFRINAGDLSGGGAAVVKMEIEAGNEITQKLLGDSLKYGVNEALLINKTWLGLSNILGHIGCTWGAL